MIALRDKIGHGIYTPSEAALYARVHTQLLNRWLYSSGGEPVIEPEFGRGDKSVSFLDLIQALAIREARNDYDVPLEKIREAYDRAREQYGIKYPFAMRHRAFLFGEGKPNQSPGRISKKKRRMEIVLNLGDNEGTKYVQMTGREHGNILIAEIAQVYMLDLTFNPQTGLAHEYRPMTFRERSILMNPTIRFGEPIVESCGITAMTLYESYKSEGSVEAAAKAYGVEREDVELAIKYNDYLQRPAA